MAGRKAGLARVECSVQPCNFFILRLRMCILSLRMCISSLRMCIFRLKIKKLPGKNGSFLRLSRVSFPGIPPLSPACPGRAVQEVLAWMRE